MTGFVISGIGLFFLTQRKTAAFLPPTHFVARFFELGQSNSFQIPASGEQRRLVDDVGQFGAGIARRAARDHGEIDPFGQLHFLGMDPQNFFATLYVGQIDGDLAIESARTQQCGIKHIGPIGGGNDDDALLGIEPVHLNEQGIEGLFALVVTSADAVAAMATDSVNFVDENDARRRLFALLKHVAHAAGADTDKHFDEIGPADGEKWDVSFAGDGAGEQRFASAGWPNEQHAFRNAAAEFLKLLRVAQKLDEFLHFVFGFFDSGDIAEGDLIFVAGQHPRF